MWIFRSTKFPLDASNNLSASQLFPPRWSRFDTETKTKKQYEWWRSEQAGRKQEEAVSLCSRWGMRKRSCSVSNCSEGGQGTFSQRGKARRRPSTHTRCIFLHRWEKHKGGRTATADRWKSVTFFCIHSAFLRDWSDVLSLDLLLQWYCWEMGLNACTIRLPVWPVARTLHELWCVWRRWESYWSLWMTRLSGRNIG